MKKILSLVLVLVMVLAVLPVKAQAKVPDFRPLDIGDNTFREVESNDSPSLADVIRNDYTVVGSLSPYDLIDYFYFEVNSYSNVVIPMIAQYSSMLYGIFDRYDECVAAGVFYEYTDDYDSFFMLDTYLYAGEYYLVVMDDDAYYNDYTFYIEISGSGSSHSHSYYYSYTVYPTCTADGYSVYSCSCGDYYYDDYTSATGHDWNAGVVITEPTATSSGLRRYTCYNCGETRDETIPATGGDDVVVFYEIESNNSQALADIIGDNYYVYAELTTSDLVDVFQFRVDEESTVDIDVYAQYNSLSIGLVDPTFSTVLKWDEYQGYENSKSHFTLDTTLEAGTYYLLVQDDDEYYNDYEFSLDITPTGNGGGSDPTDPDDHPDVGDIVFNEVENNNSTGMADTIGNYYTVNAGLTTSDLIDFFRFTLEEESEVLVVTLAQYDSLMMGIMDTSEEFLAAATYDGRSDNGKSYFVMDATLPAGTYYIAVMDEDDYYNDYTFFIEWTPVGGGHTHSYTEVVTDPTCTEDGFTTYTCSCGDSYVDDILPATGHTYEEGYCTVCDEEDPDYTGIQTGSFGDNVTFTLTPDGTLTISGTGAIQEVYGLEYTIRHLVVESGITEIGDESFLSAHDIESVTLADTVTHIGYRAFMSCGSLATVNMSASLETIGEEAFMSCHPLTTISLPVSLKSIGSDAFAGTNLTTVYYDGTMEQWAEITLGDYALSGAEVIWAGGHTHVYTETVTPPTCTEQGFTTYTCDICGETYTDNFVPESGHVPTEGVVIQEPTETEPGVLQYSCSVCGLVWESEIPVLEHTHSYTETVTPPTCTENGYTTYTCACGDSYVDNEVPAAGHAWNEGTVIKEPTETETGLLEYLCVHCGETREEEIPVLDHVHAYTETVTRPTCTGKGFTTYTCSCGDTYTDNYVPATGHTWNEGIVTKEPTETETGLKEYICTKCGETKEEVLPTVEHTHAYTETVTQPTCTEKGYTTYTCSCGDTYTDHYVPATGHEYQNGLCIHCGEDDPNSTGPSANPFQDVAESDYFFDPVMWAVENGITSGLNATTFGPNNPCTRAQVVTFLWRAAGQPEPASTNNPFTDVTESDYFYKPVLWAVENGITSGMSATTFGPNNTCTRGQVVTFLWRANGQTMPESSSNPFTDVAEADYFYNPVLWAVENGITSGLNATTFGAANPCTRGQVVTFLFRAYSIDES